MPDEVEFATKPQIALAQIRSACQAGVAPAVVLVDAADGDETGFRDGITALGLPYVVGVRAAAAVWPCDILPLPSGPCSDRGARPVRLRTAPGDEPVSIKALAMHGIVRDEQMSWCEGSKPPTLLALCLPARACRASHPSEPCFAR